MMRNYCTYFDSNFLSRGMALYTSLQRHAQPFKLWVLCMDEEVYTVLDQLKQESLILVRLSQLEANDRELLKTRANRSRIEYYFTCTAAWILYLLSQNNSIDILTYLDADLYFFANPQPLFDELGNNSVLITEHRFPRDLCHLEVYGRYNVGWLSFRNDLTGHKVLEWWRERCLEWCYDGLDGTRFADQKYLDEWPERFTNVVVSRLKGANLAPWNISQYHLEAKNSVLTVDGEPVLFYHFHYLNQIAPLVYNTGLDGYKTTASPLLQRRIYGTYIRTLKTIKRDIGANTIGQNRYVYQGDFFNQLLSSHLLISTGSITREVYVGGLIRTLVGIIRPFWHSIRAHLR